MTHFCVIRESEYAISVATKKSTPATTGQDKAIKNCSPDHDRGGVKIQKKVRIAYSEFSHLWADHLAGPSNISYA